MARGRGATAAWQPECGLSQACSQQLAAVRRYLSHRAGLSILHHEHNLQQASKAAFSVVKRASSGQWGAGMQAVQPGMQTEQPGVQAAAVQSSATHIHSPPGPAHNRTLALLVCSMTSKILIRLGWFMDRITSTSRLQAAPPMQATSVLCSVVLGHHSCAPDPHWPPSRFVLRPSSNR